jgi:hypothetical protein
MYMFNRSQAQNSMSEFIQGQILEEDDQRNEQEDELEVSKNSRASAGHGGFDTNQNDFMFQMDKGLISSRINKNPTNVKCAFSNITFTN